MQILYEGTLLLEWAWFSGVGGVNDATIIVKVYTITDRDSLLTYALSVCVETVMFQGTGIKY